MNWFDIFLLVVLGLHVINGFSRGLIKQVFDIFGFIVVIILSFWGSRLFSEALAEYIDPENIIPHHEVIENLGLEIALEQAPQLIAGVITFLLLFLIFSIVFRLFSSGFKWINRIPVIGFFNRLAGTVMGVLIGAIFVYIIIAAVSIIPLQFFMDALEGSEIVFFANHYLAPAAEAIKEFALDFYLNLNS